MQREGLTWWLLARLFWGRRGEEPRLLSSLSASPAPALEDQPALSKHPCNLQLCFQVCLTATPFWDVKMDWL